jgi:hypothetical protein
MPQVQPVVEAKPANYTQEQLAAYLEYQVTGKATKVRYFDQPVGDTHFTDGDRQKIRDARKMHRDTLSHGPAKAAIIQEIKQKKHVITGHRLNVLGNKRVLRLTDTSIEVPTKPKLKLVKAPKVKAVKIAKAEVNAATPAVAAPVQAQA